MLLSIDDMWNMAPGNLDEVLIKAEASYKAVGTKETVDKCEASLTQDNTLGKTVSNITLRYRPNYM